jgi:hypothetical protein
MNLRAVVEKLKKIPTKAGQKFRRGDHEKGFLGAGSGAVLLVLGSSGYFGHLINNMVGSLTNSNSTSTNTGTPSAGNIGSFINDFIALLGLIAVILGIVEYHYLKLKFHQLIEVLKK